MYTTTKKMAATSSKAKPIMSTGMVASRNPARMAMIQPQLDNKHKKQTKREKCTLSILWVSNGCKLLFVLTLAVLMNPTFLFPKSNSDLRPHPTLRVC